MSGTMRRQRGLPRGASFTDVDGRECSIQESSLATDTAIRFGVDKSHDGRTMERMHLTQDMVRELLPLLKAFAKTGRLPR
jgi:hypothetical protein